VFRRLSEPSDEQAGDEADTVSNNPPATPRLDIPQYLKIASHNNNYRMPTTRRTYICRIQNHSQVAGALDRHGWSASKLWVVFQSRLELVSGAS
jgi:hypothetical protein